MTEKRFENRLDKSNIKFNVLNPVWDYEKEDGLNVFEMIDLLNEQHERIKELNQKNQQLDEKVCLLTMDLIKTKSYEQLEKELNRIKDKNEQLKHNNKMLIMKMSEVSTKYRLLKEFSDDTNPNDAVKTVLHELMMITKEYR